MSYAYSQVYVCGDFPRTTARDIFFIFCTFFLSVGIYTHPTSVFISFHLYRVTTEEAELASSIDQEKKHCS